MSSRHPLGVKRRRRGDKRHRHKAVSAYWKVGRKKSATPLRPSVAYGTAFTFTIGYVHQILWLPNLFHMCIGGLKPLQFVLSSWSLLAPLLALCEYSFTWVGRLYHRDISARQQ